MPRLWHWRPIRADTRGWGCFDSCRCCVPSSDSDQHWRFSLVRCGARRSTHSVLRSPAVRSCDDGTQENAIGTGESNPIPWLTSYTDVAGAEVITDVVFDAGTDAVNKYNTVDPLIGPAGTSFFVSAFHQEVGAEFAAAMDQRVPVLGRNWIAVGSVSSPPPAMSLLETLGDPVGSSSGNWIVRANAIATGTTCGANGCGVGEECDPGGILGVPPDDAACPGRGGLSFFERVRRVRHSVSSRDGDSYA